MSKFMLFNGDKKGEKHAVLYSKISHICSQGGGNIGSMVFIEGKYYLSGEEADVLIARLNGFLEAYEGEKKPKLFRFEQDSGSPTFICPDEILHVSDYSASIATITTSQGLFRVKGNADEIVKKLVFEGHISEVVF